MYSPDGARRSVKIKTPSVVHDVIAPAFSFFKAWLRLAAGSCLGLLQRRLHPLFGARLEDPNFTVRLPKQLVATVDKIARQENTSRAEIMRQLMTEALEARKTRP
jgi:hypothetical protein